MSIPLLVTKLFIPHARPKLVSRPRLVERINQGLHRKLTLISAPAGFGKTTLVNEWISSNHEMTSPVNIAWLSIDENDNDSNRFFLYLCIALNQLEDISPKLCEGVQVMLDSPTPPLPDTLLRIVINELSVHSENVVLVLDDLHLVDSPDIYASLTFLVDNQPQNLHLILTTREDPFLPLSRLRSRDQITEIRAADLKLTPLEVNEFLNEVMSLGLTEDASNKLGIRTEGWITGLQLAAISLQGNDNYSKAIDRFSGSNRLVLDYLVDEVLNQQPVEIQHFLLQTSVLSRLSGSVCNAITGRDDGYETLEYLERSNLFLISLDNERLWYRYHHLFGDLLLQRLYHKFPDQVSENHKKASEWFSQVGDYRSAIEHSLAAKDYHTAGRFLEQKAVEFLERGENSAVVRWMNQLPEELIKSKPYLSVLHSGVLLLLGQSELAQIRLSETEKSLHLVDPEDSTHSADLVMGLINNNKAYIAFFNGNHKKTLEYARKALEHLPPNNRLARVQASVYLGVALRYTGNFHAAFQTYSDIQPVAKKLGGRISIQIEHNLGDLLWYMGELELMKTNLERILRNSEQIYGRTDLPYYGFIYVLFSRVYYQWNQLDEALVLVEKGVALSRTWNVPELLALTLIDYGVVLWAKGELEEAQEVFRESVQLMENFSPWGQKYAEAYLAKFSIYLDNFTAGENWANTNDLDLGGPYQYQREKEYLTHIHFLISQQRYDEATVLTERMMNLCKDSGNRLTEMECALLLAKISCLQHNLDKSVSIITDVLDFAEPQGYIRLFVDCGSEMARILYLALEKQISPVFVGKVLAAFDQVQHSLPGTAAQSLIDPLTDRELDVLELIAEGLSRQEIADELIVSLNTVKTHARNVYQKLGVNSQTQAVSKARRLGLLEED